MKDEAVFIEEMAASYRRVFPELPEWDARQIAELSVTHFHSYFLKEEV